MGIEIFANRFDQSRACDARTQAQNLLMGIASRQQGAVGDPHHHRRASKLLRPFPDAGDEQILTRIESGGGEHGEQH